MTPAVFRHLLPVVALAASVATRPAGAEPPPADSAVVSEEQVAARADFREGSRLAQEDDWAGALARYEQSESRFPHATTLYNVGYCRERLGDFAAAARDTQGALLFEERFPGRGLSDELRARAEGALRELASKLSRVELEVRTDELTLRVDGRALEVFVVEGRSVGFVADAQAAPSFSSARGKLTLTLAPGRHVLEWQAAGRSATRDLELRAGEAVTLTLPPAESVAPATPLAAGTTPPPRKQAPSPAAPDDRPRPLRTIGIGVLATGGAAALVGLGAGLLAAGTNRELEASCTDDGACPPGQSDRIDAFQTQAGVATVALATSAVLAGLGITLLVVDSSSSRSAALTLRVASGVTLTGQFH